jgi:hypothetical protein
MNAARGGQPEGETPPPADAAPAVQAPPPAEVRAPAPIVEPASVAPQSAAPPQSWQSAMPTIVPEVVHNTRIPVHTKERLMMLARVPGETMKTILVRALEREMDRMEKELNAKSNKQG